MIDIRYSFSETLHRLELTGHAEYNNGNDIVCAGVSAITYTLAGFLHNNEADGRSFMVLDSGLGWITSKRSPRTDIAFEMAIIGYAQIANTYSDNVTLHIGALGT